MFTVIYRGIDGSVWQLAGPGQGAEGVRLGSLAGLVGSASAETTVAPGRVGVIRTGVPVVPVMSGTVNVVISGMDASPKRPTPGVLRAWRRAWSHLVEGELMIGSSESTLLRAAVRLSDPLGPPANDPFDHPGQRHERSLSVVADSGCWLGPSTPYPGTGEPVVVHNRGDLVAWPLVEWSGSGRSITGPGVAPLSLPTAPDGATVNTDPATGTVITVGGEPDPDLWSQLRGRSFPVGVPPHGQAEWTFSPGTTATVTPRVLDPWGW